CFTHAIHPALTQRGIHLLTWDQLTEREIEIARDYYRNNLFPVLTPLAVDPGHPFPFISNLSMSLGVRLRAPGSVTGSSDEDDAEVQFARVKVPQLLPRWVR